VTGFWKQRFSRCHFCYRWPTKFFSLPLSLPLPIVKKIGVAFAVALFFNLAVAFPVSQLLVAFSQKRIFSAVFQKNCRRSLRISGKNSTENGTRKSKFLGKIEVRKSSFHFELRFKVSNFEFRFPDVLALRASLILIYWPFELPKIFVFQKVKIIDFSFDSILSIKPTMAIGISWWDMLNQTNTTIPTLNIKFIIFGTLPSKFHESVKKSKESLKPCNVKSASIRFFELLNKNIFNGTLKIRFLLILVGDVYCCSRLFNSDNLLIFTFGNFKFYLKDKVVNN